MAAMMPAWITDQRRDRGLCEDCGQEPAATCWQHEDGPRICWTCCSRRQEAARA